MEIKVSDYIAKRLKEIYKVKHFFMISAGGAMHLNDSLGRYIPYTCNHHEQACAIGADGYASIKQTQKNFFKGKMTGSSSDSGVSVSDFSKIARGFGIKSVKISNPKTLSTQIKNVLKINGSVLCEVITETNYSFSPKLSAKKLPDGTMISPSLEDMFPFLDRKEFEENLIK